jgi:hypothetical protein
MRCRRSVWLCGDPRPHDIDHVTARRHDTQEGKRAAVDNDIAIDQNLELSVVSVDHVHVGFQLAAHLGCHTGGVEAGDSVGAVTDGDPCHGALPGSGDYALLPVALCMSVLKRSTGTGKIVTELFSVAISASVCK